MRTGDKEDEMRGLVIVLFVAVLMAVPSDAMAYIGPGAGLSAIGTVIGVIVAVFLAIVGFVWYPIKRLMMKIKSPSPARENNKA
jgi:uncharacterized protein YacL